MPEDSKPKPATGADGIAPQGPTSGLLKDSVEIGAELMRATRDGREVFGSAPPPDTFRVDILNSYEDAAGVQVCLGVNNQSSHGIYIERIAVVRGDGYEGNSGPAVFSVTRQKSSPGTQSRPPFPILLSPFERESLELTIANTAGTWPSTDSHGIIEFHITKLNETVTTPRRIPFAIRHRR